MYEVLVIVPRPMTPLKRGEILAVPIPTMYTALDAARDVTGQAC